MSRVIEVRNGAGNLNVLESGNPKKSSVAQPEVPGELSREVDRNESLPTARLFAGRLLVGSLERS